MTETIVDETQLARIREFLYREASYLDRPDLDAWIELYTEDGTYWMPAAEDQTDPLNHISHFYDDRVMMEIRRRNFVHPRAASKDYKVRASHLISGIRIVEQDRESKRYVVTSNFHCAYWYWDKQTLYAGTYRHELIDGPDDFRIRHKRVNLINCDAVQDSMVLYL